MKSKISKKLLIILLILAISIPMISYAINSPIEKEEELFISSDKKEAARGEKVVLTLSLNLIQYENFEFILTSNVNINNVSTEENVDVINDSNSFKIIVNKSELDINQIDLYYQIPEEIGIGTKIELTGIVKQYKSENIETEESSDKQITEENKEQTVTIIITVVEERSSNQNNNQSNSQNNLENQISENETKKEENISDKTSNQQTKTQQSVLNKTTSSAILASTIADQETNMYNGESNNYLSTLEIINFNINPEFSKTITTYFVEVGSEVTQITINAEAEDENAVVNIYGNDNLQDGENKVLISVTAENGDVKIYRIYVTKK